MRVRGVGLDQHALVVVDREEVDRGRDQRLVVRTHEVAEALVAVDVVDDLRVAVEEQRVQEETVAVGVVALGGGQVLVS